jgi:hypothetical protein
VQHLDGVGGGLDAGADLAEDGGLLVDVGVEASPA